MSDSPHEPDFVAHASTVTLGELERRVVAIEDTKPQVQASKLNDLVDEVRSLKRAFYAFGFTVIGGAIVFAFSVFELLGR